MDDKLITQFEVNTKAIETIENQISKEVETFQNQLRTLREKDSELREAIKTAMEENDVKKFENQFVSITYVAPTKRKSFDITRFKQDKPETYEKYVKESEVKASVRIKTNV